MNQTRRHVSRRRRRNAKRVLAEAQREYNLGRITKRQLERVLFGPIGVPR